MEIAGWDALARWRDRRMGERGDLWHRAIIDPSVLRLLGRVRGQRILDLGCGNGYLTRRWARQGAELSLGVDSSRASLALARQRERRSPTGARFLLRKAEDLHGLGDQSFDAVVANMALLDIEELAGTVREVARVLRPGGRFVFSLCHPCFDLDERSGWVVERFREPDGVWHDIVWRKVREYRSERPTRVPWDMDGGRTGFTTSYHRTLSTYSGVLATHGFVIVRLEEPSPGAEAVRKSPQGPYMRQVPLHLTVLATPLPRRPGRPERRRTAQRRSARTARRRARA